MHGARWFSFAEIKKATNNFAAENEIGEGGYGKVYNFSRFTTGCINTCSNLHLPLQCFPDQVLYLVCVSWVGLCWSFSIWEACGREEGTRGLHARGRGVQE
jgi:hypothetical protein